MNKDFLRGVENVSEKAAERMFRNRYKVPQNDTRALLRTSFWQGKNASIHQASLAATEGIRRFRGIRRQMLKGLALATMNQNRFSDNRKITNYF